MNIVVTSAPSSDVLTNSPPRATKSKTSRNCQKEDRLIDFGQLSCTGTPLAVSISRIIISISWKDDQLLSASL